MNQQRSAHNHSMKRCQTKKKKKEECKCKQKLWQPTINIVRKRYKLDVYDMEAGEKQLFVRERYINSDVKMIFVAKDVKTEC